MKSLAELRAQLAAGLFEFTRHAFRRAVERNIGEEEICEAGVKAIVIEDYPADKYSPSCLLLGFTLKGTAAAHAGIAGGGSAQGSYHHAL